MVSALQHGAPELRAWPCNKLATGAVIAAGVGSGDLAVRPDGILDPTAFDELERRLPAPLA